MKTAEEVAERTGASATTVRTDARFAKAIDRIASFELGDELAHDILFREVRLTQQDVIAMGKLPQEELEAAVKEALDDLKAPKSHKKRKQAKADKKDEPAPQEASDASSSPHAAPHKEEEFGPIDLHLQQLRELESSGVLAFTPTSPEQQAAEVLEVRMLNAALALAKDLDIKDCEPHVVGLALLNRVVQEGKIGKLLDPQ